MVAKKTTGRKKAVKKTVRKKAASKRKYGKGAAEAVKKEVRAYKKGKAVSGPKRKPVKSRQQAIAIGLSKARKKGVKVPKKP